MSYWFHMEELKIGCEYEMFFVFTDPPWMTFELIEVEEPINYTSNVRPMWDKALGFRIRDLEDRSGEDIETALAIAWLHMAMNPEQYEPMNPPNGWGNYEGALKILSKLHDWAQQHPKAILRMSY